MLINKKYPSIFLLMIMVVLLVGCSQESANETASDTPPSATVEKVTTPPTQTTNSSALTPEQRAARKAERQARREQRLADMTPEQLAALEARRAEHQARKQADQEPASDNDEAEAEKQARRAERRQHNFNQRMQDKAWWNKGGNKLAGLALTDQQKTDMNTQLQTLLSTRDQLATELQPLWESNRDALASGNIGLIASNLESIDRLEAQWQQERRNTMIEILESLDSEQLAGLAQANSSVSTLDWLDIDLDKGTQRPQSNRQAQRENRRQNRQNNNN